MLPAATIRALMNPAFTAAEFTPTQWASAEDKAKFANALMKFIANEFPRQSFTRSLYQRLSNTFGHIAHTNVDGFYGAFFERDFDKVVFLEQTLSWPHFGDPTFTFCDVERAVKRRLRAARVIDIFRLLEADATRRRELGTLARLQEKYGVRTPPPDLAPTGSQIPTRRADNAHAIGHELGDRLVSPSNPERTILHDKYSDRRGKLERRGLFRSASHRLDLLPLRPPPLPGPNSWPPAIFRHSNPKFQPRDVRFEITDRHQTRRITAIVFSAIAILIAFCSVVLHFK